MTWQQACETIAYAWNLAMPNRHVWTGEEIFNHSPRGNLHDIPFWLADAEAYLLEGRPTP